jgi:hypothetical protein
MNWLPDTGGSDMKLFTALFLLTAATSAAAETKLNPINVLNRDVASAEYEIDMLQLTSNSVERQKHVAALDAVKERVEADVKPALAFAKAHPDLAKAVKAYYLAATNYFDAAFVTNAYERSAAQRAKSELDSADNALHLEEKLAGFK